MNKNIIGCAVLAALLIGSTNFSHKACADSMPYEPIFESMPITEAISTIPTTKPEVTVEPIQIAATEQPVVTTPIVNAQPKVTANTFETDNLQNALMDLDSAQTSIKTQLIQYRNEYQALDSQYQTIKAQRKLKAKQVKEAEKRIKSLDCTKEKIKKNMQ